MVLASNGRCEAPRALCQSTETVEPRIATLYRRHKDDRAFVSGFGFCVCTVLADERLCSIEVAVGELGQGLLVTIDDSKPAVVLLEERIR